MKNHDLEIIKRNYGEEMMHICRGGLGLVLEHEGLLPKILEANFAHQKNLGEDIKAQRKIDSFVAFILEKSGLKKEGDADLVRNKSAVELITNTKYILYPECKTEKDIQSFRHFYHRNIGTTPVYKVGQRPEKENGEELCTFRGGRLEDCRVWFAVKEGAEKLDRKDFINPRRQDEYGTSVISIQFSKGKHSMLSIKNRYNHSVLYSDATFDNNLDLIRPGLFKAFQKDYQIEGCIETGFELDGYVWANDGKIYPYNIESNNIYYCPNNTIIENGEVVKLPTHQMLVDNYIIDCKEKNVYRYGRLGTQACDGFTDSFNGLKKINVEKHGVIKITKATGDEAVLQINKKGEITSFEDYTLENAGYNFLERNRALKRLILPGLKTCEDNFLYYNRVLEEINLENLKVCGQNFLFNNEGLKAVNFENLEECGDRFLYRNCVLEKFVAPNLKACGHYFLALSQIKELNLENLVKCGDDFLMNNSGIEKLIAPNLKECGHYFLSSGQLKELILENLVKCGKSFMFHDRVLEKFIAPNLKECGDTFMFSNNALKELSLENLVKCGESFLFDDTALEKFIAPNLKECGDNFLIRSKRLKEINVESLERCGCHFLGNNEKLEKLNAACLEECGDNFLHFNDVLKQIDVKNLKKCGDGFLSWNNALKVLNVKNLKKCGDEFLTYNTGLEKFIAPNLKKYGKYFLDHILSAENISKIPTFDLSKKVIRRLSLKSGVGLKRHKLSIFKCFIKNALKLQNSKTEMTQNI